MSLIRVHLQSIFGVPQLPMAFSLHLPHVIPLARERIIKRGGSVTFSTLGLRFPRKNSVVYKLPRCSHLLQSCNSTEQQRYSMPKTL